jgi:PHD/YefM family antitoxin component YafN of YafNO toxin-antitoxin module
LTVASKKPVAVLGNDKPTDAPKDGEDEYEYEDDKSEEHVR